MNKNKLYIGIALGILVSVLVGIVVISKVLKRPILTNSTQAGLLGSVPTTAPIRLNTNLIPTNPPSKGQGVDVTNEAVIASTRNVSILASKLPFREEITFANGDSGVIGILAPSYQYPEWLLQISIDGVSFNAPKNSPIYASEKSKFKEVASIVTTWITSNGADPNGIFIKWSDNSFEDAVAQEWLAD